MSDMAVGGLAGDFVVFEGIVADGIAVKDRGVSVLSRS